MRVTEYAFVSEWHVAASPERCWREIERMLSAGGAPTWWRAVAVTRPPLRLAVGEELELTVRSPLGYALRVTLTLTEAVPQVAVAASSEGDLSGSGRLTIAPEGSGSALRWVWEVRTQKRWMNAAAPFLHPVFARAHEHVMVEGERGLHRALDPG